MKENIVPSSGAGRQADAGKRPGALDRWARALVLDRLGKVSWGTLRLVEGDEERLCGPAPERAAAPADGGEGLNATLTVIDPRFYGAIAAGGVNGAAEAYINGWWRADDLTALIRLMIRNRPVLQTVDRGVLKLRAPADKLFHWLRRNTRRGSRANIAAHYDLGNEFYALFLDETMTYSCGVFEREDATLEEASIAKYDRLCRKLDLRPEDHVLEIGTGWGGFARHAARHYGCRVTTTTISRRQHEFAVERIARAGLDDRVTLLREDYRDLTGRYDKLVSIEMIEAVGHEYLDEYFGRCGRLLAPDGLMALQAITIADQEFDRYKRSVDFIKRYIFPGGCLPSVTAMCRSATVASDLRLVHLEDIGPHYAPTLRRWRERFFERIEDVRAQGFTDEFVRLWEFYLCYCEGGFIERSIGDVHMVFAKPLNRREPILGVQPANP